MIRISVDAELCSGQGRCYTVSPDLLEYDDEGFVTIRGQTMDVPAGMEQAARDAEMACPESAITLEETADA